MLTISKDLWFWVIFSFYPEFYPLMLTVGSGVYADAHEWVELPNVTGMALFADGGYLASKPYAAGGAYINKMSDYCKSCAYNVKEKVGEDACPFNYLYWDFISRNREKISTNQRMSMIFRTYDKMTDVRKAEIARDSQVFLDRMA